MSFGTIPLSPDDKPDSFVLLSMYKKLESENEKLHGLVRDALACVQESSRGFRTHPKTYRDLYSRAKKLGVEL